MVIRTRSKAGRTGVTDTKEETDQQEQRGQPKECATGNSCNQKTGTDIKAVQIKQERIDNRFLKVEKEKTTDIPFNGKAKSSDSSSIEGLYSSSDDELQSIDSSEIESDLDTSQTPVSGKRRFPGRRGKKKRKKYFQDIKQYTKFT